MCCLYCFVKTVSTSRIEGWNFIVNVYIIRETINMLLYALPLGSVWSLATCTFDKQESRMKGIIVYVT